MDTKPRPCIVSRGHTPFHKRGKESGKLFYSSLLHCSSNHSTVFCHMRVIIIMSSCFVSLGIPVLPAATRKVPDPFLPLWNEVWPHDTSPCTAAKGGWDGVACTFIMSSDSRILCSRGKVPLLAFILLSRHMMQRFDDASCTKHGFGTVFVAKDGFGTVFVAKDGFGTVFVAKDGFVSVSNPRMLLCVSVLIYSSYCVSC